MNAAVKVLRTQPRVVFAVATAVLMAGAWFWFGRSPAVAATPTRGATPVLVDTALVARADVPVYLEGLGTVQAFYTVTVNSRVDGQIDSVNFIEGQTVKKGQLLAQIDPRPLQAALDQAVAAEAKDSAMLASAKRDLDRYMVLAPQNLASQQTLDNQRATVDQTAAQLQADRAAINNARTQLEYASISSPIYGRTGIRRVDPGNIVHASDTGGIVVVTQMQPIAVIFTLPEDALESVNQALEGGAVQVSALSRDDTTVLDTGTLSLIDNQIDATTGTMRLKATFPNPHNTLWPGQFINVRLLLKHQQDALTLPTTAIEHGPDGLFAYVVKADATVEARPISTGVESGALTVVMQGLSAGERVVTSNQYRLQPGQAVRTQAASRDTARTAPGDAPAGSAAGSG